MDERTLRFASYTTGGRLETTLDATPPEGVSVKGNLWKFTNPAGRIEGPFTIGVGVRVPDDGENREYWGPMFVFDIHDCVHRAKYRKITRDLKNGSLTP